MREIRQSGSEGGEPHPTAASLPLSCWTAWDVFGNGGTCAWGKLCVRRDLCDVAAIAFERIGNDRTG
jgi:hypothetical protein